MNHTEIQSMITQNSKVIGVMNENTIKILDNAVERSWRHFIFPELRFQHKVHNIVQIMYYMWVNTLFINLVYRDATALNFNYESQTVTPLWMLNELWVLWMLFWAEHTSVVRYLLTQLLVPLFLLGTSHRILLWLNLVALAVNTHKINYSHEHYCL